MHASPVVGELKAAALSSRSLEQISAVRFSPQEELLWSGTESGWLYANTMLEIERFSSVRAHQHRICDLVPLPPSAGDGVLSLSADTVRCHSSGGIPRLAFHDSEADLTACAIDMQSPHQAVIGRASGALGTLDLHTGHLLKTVDSVPEGVAFIRTPGPRGLLALGGASGQVLLVDPRQGFKVEHSVTAHAGGLVAMDLAAGLLATAGLGTRQGQLVHDTIVKVYDLRSTVKVMATVPFSAGPGLLRFHPRLSSTLLIAASSGIFSLAQIQGAPYTPMTQVDTEGDLLTAVDFASSGECLAFGGSGGFVHLWGYNQEPRVNLRTNFVEIPPRLPKPSTALGEFDSFAAIPPLYPAEGKPLSEWDTSLFGRVDLRPRLVDLSILKDVKQVDFVSYIPNPQFRRGKPRGEASRLIAALRNQRLQPTSGSLLRLAEDGNGAPQMTSLLPAKYRKVHITVDADRRYEEFDFAKYNRTRFAGLENGLANCYANALVQVLYFIPSLRAFLLGSVPDASLEFSLLDELALLVRMLASESGHACQATNLFRALRQSREATGLGLLEGHAQKGMHGADFEVEANKDRSLARRIQTLLRFMLDKLHSEAAKRKPGVADASQQRSEGAEPGSGGTGGAEEAGSTPAASGEEAKPSSVVEEVFGIRMRQKMQSLQGSKPVLEREARAFQVDMQYPRRAKGQSSADEPRPSFSQVLLASLRAESETRAWFNEELKYQYVRQTRTPLALPQVLAVGSGLQDRSHLHWWQPVKERSDTEGQAAERDWAPLALALELCNGEARALEADSASELRKQGAADRTIYELTAVVALVEEEEAVQAHARGTSEGDEGHLVAHVRVPPSYLSKDAGLMPTPKARPPSPGVTPTRQSWPGQRSGPPALPEGPLEGLPENPFGVEPGGQAQEREGAAEEHGLPEDPFGSDGGSHTGALGSPGEQQGGSLEAAGSCAAMKAQLQGTAEEDSANAAAERAAAETVAGQDPSGNSPEAAADIPQQFAGLKVTAERSSSLARSGSLRCGSGEGAAWLLINDFSISTIPTEEVLALFGGHKLPCLLFYSQVSAQRRGARGDSQMQPAPVLSKDAFHYLCKDAPLQASLVGLSRLGKPSFRPLQPEEGPRPGILLGLDAEFVAFSPPTKALRGGVEVETAPSRLGLARVSVVRGEGPLEGKACIDDYIRTTEPVYDYLTQYSGLKPGDLDPTMSPHHLTTLKAAYLKLRYLVDSGCMFVGHGLKKDFRMINIVVPPSQVVDTVDLFYLKRQRKLSLRFLAAYLLKLDIQQYTHNSIEDSRTALSLYKMYQKIEAEGRVREVLLGMYTWGKQHGWDPQLMRDSLASVLPSPVNPVSEELQR